MTSTDAEAPTGPEVEKVIAKPLYALPRPLAIDARLDKIRKAVRVLYGPDTRMHQIGPTFVIFTAGELCNCQACDTFMRKVADLDYLDLPGFMILCSECGNKRCPHATDHEEDCTGSNAPGQPGSSYAAFRGDHE